MERNFFTLFCFSPFVQRESMFGGERTRRPTWGFAPCDPRPGQSPGPSFACFSRFRTTATAFTTAAQLLAVAWNLCLGWREKLPDGECPCMRRLSYNVNQCLGGRELAGWGTTAAQLPNAPLLRLSLRSFFVQRNWYVWLEREPPDGERWKLDGHGAQPPGPRRNLVSLSTLLPARKPPRQNLSQKGTLRPRSGDKLRARGADPLPRTS